MDLCTEQENFQYKTHAKAFSHVIVFTDHFRNPAYEKSSENTSEINFKTSSEETPFQCEVCGKAFSKNCSLKSHVRTHTGETPYPCEVCGKAFSEKSNLRKHMRTHTGEIPYSCEICAQAFSRRDK